MEECKSCSCVDPGTCVECLKGKLEQYKEALDMAVKDIILLNQQFGQVILVRVDDYLTKAKGG